MIQAKTQRRWAEETLARVGQNLAAVAQAAHVAQLLGQDERAARLREALEPGPSRLARDERASCDMGRRRGA